jgi:glyoxylase-like metal-dependent hydrolase (beta-lactamase superfamily II)
MPESQKESQKDIQTIDCDYIRPRFAASYLIRQGEGATERAAFVDNNTAHSVPLLLKALKDAGLKPEQVEYVIITHVHLDHAGGSSALMKACPNAALLAHPRAVPHVVDPSRLVASARAVYGEEAFEKLYGVIEPIAATRVRAIGDGELISWGSKRLRFFHTRGHANHHFCVELLESKNGQSVKPESVVFTGDAFGLAYPDLQKSGLFVFPSTSPTDFDAQEARKSIHAVVATNAQAAYPTHFGAVHDLPAAADQLLKWIDFSEELLNEAQHSQLSDEKLAGFCGYKIRNEMSRALGERGMNLSGDVAELLKLDLELNAAGLAHVAVKRRNPK